MSIQELAQSSLLIIALHLQHSTLVETVELLRLISLYISYLNIKYHKL